MRNEPEERRSHPPRGGSTKSRSTLFIWTKYGAAPADTSSKNQIYEWFNNKGVVCETVGFLFFDKMIGESLISANVLYIRLPFQAPLMS